MSYENRAQFTYMQNMQIEHLLTLWAALINMVSTYLLAQRSDVLQFLLTLYRISEQDTLYKHIYTCEAFL